MSEALRVALVCGGGFQGAALLDALDELEGVEAWVVDSLTDNVNCSRAHRSIVAPPLRAEAAFHELLERLAREQGVGLFVPCTQRELRSLARLAPTLALHGARAAVCPESLLARLLDKVQACEWLAEMGLPCLPPVHPGTASAATPLFGRPRTGWGSRDTLSAQSPGEIEQRLGSAGATAYCWQRLLPRFEEYSADFAIRADGVCSPVVVRKRVRTSGGFAVVSDRAEDAAAVALCVRTASALACSGAQGVLNVQVLAPPGEGPYVSDVNPRVGTSSSFTLGAGVNLMGWLCGRPSPPPADVPAPLRMVRHLRQEFFHRLDRGSFDGVVFDLDDTLLDHKAWMLAKLRLLWQAHRAELPDEGVFWPCALRRVEEGPRDRLLDVIAADLGLDPSLVPGWISTYRRCHPVHLPLFPDVAPVLVRLRAAGLKLGLITDNPAASQRQKLARSELLRSFDGAVLTAELGAAKPCPLGFTAVAEAVGVRPGRLVMVGDNPYADLAGAFAAGYGHGVLLQRRGTFFNYARRLWAPMLGRALALTSVVDGLPAVAEMLSAR